MPAADRHIPNYRHDKPRDLAVVRIDGHDHYFGMFGSPESYEKYHRLLPERHAHGPELPLSTLETKAGAENLTISEMVLGYYRHCEQYYVRNGKATNQVRMIRLALKVLDRLYGSTLIREFGPLNLEACQAEFVRQGLSRAECNRRTTSIKHAFRWAIAKIDEEPIDGLEILAIEPHRIARTIRDCPEEVNDIPLSRDVLARRFEDFASISDEDLDSIIRCTVVKRCWRSHAPTRRGKGMVPTHREN